MIVNNRQHVGLQKLSALSAVSRGSLGPCKRWKFVSDDRGEESVLVCSCHRILENLELSCPVGQLVYETVKAHQAVYRTGSGCLLFLAGAWSRAAMACLHRGISVAHIISAMSEGMESCLDVCRKCSISLDDVARLTPLEKDIEDPLTSELQLANKPNMEASQASQHMQGTQVEGKSLKNSTQRKIKLSRHFCESKSEDSSNVTHAAPPRPLDVAHVAQGLSHGCEDTMTLALAAAQMQSRTRREPVGPPMLDVSKVMTCLVPGLSEEQSHVVPGCVVLLSDEQTLLTRRLMGRELKVALITGDLSDTYRHLGFRRPTGIQRVSEHLAGSSSEEDWVERVGALLSSLDVNVVLVGGHACEKVIQRCRRHRILVVERVKVSILEAFADSTGALPVSYATQLSRRCVGAGATVAIWRDLGGGGGTRPSAAVNICPGGSSPLVTAVLTGFLRDRLLAVEDQFWACAHRLHLALEDGALLPGAGRTEMLCVHHLLAQAERHAATDGLEPRTKTWKAANPYRGVVLQLMADALVDYVSAVMVNTGRFSEVQARTLLNRRLRDLKGQQGVAANSVHVFLEGAKQAGGVSSAREPDRALAVEVYDNLSVKQEAWRKALDVVFLVLQTDAEVITGVGQDTDTAKQNLMLL